MVDDNREIHIEDTAASGGSKEGVVRWVLLFGTLGAIVLLSIIWMTGALTQGDQEEEITATGNMEATSDDEGDGTDSIVGMEADDLDAAGDDVRMEDGVEVVENDAPSETPEPETAPEN